MMAVTAVDQLTQAITRPRMRQAERGRHREIGSLRSGCGVRRLVVVVWSGGINESGCGVDRLCGAVGMRGGGPPLSGGRERLGRAGHGWKRTWRRTESAEACLE